MRKLILLGLLIFSAESVMAQKYLVLEKLGTRKRFEYFVGDQLSFRLLGEDFFRTGTIADLADSVIVFDYAFFSLKNITAINSSGERGRRVNAGPYPVTLMLAGVLLFAGDLFNETVIAGNKATLNKGIVIASSSLVGTGLLLMFVNSDIKKLNRRWRLRVVDI